MRTQLLATIYTGAAIASSTYIDRVKAGHIVPGAEWTIVRELPTTTVIDGHWEFWLPRQRKGDGPHN